MFVIAKRSIQFIHEGDFFANQGVAGAKSPRKHLVTFSKDIQEIPDWVGEQNAFKTATLDGTITEVVTRSAAPVKAKVEAPEVAITEHHVKFLQASGYPVKTIPEAKKFVAKLNDKARDGFFTDAAAWTEPQAVNLEKMTKAELQAHAEVHGLTLDDGLKRDEMIAAIEAHAAK